MTIREIDRAMLRCVDEETGEIDLGRFEKLRMKRERKIRNIAAWILELGSDQRAIDEEIKRLQALKKRNASQSNSLKSYLEYVLAGENYKTDKFRVTFRRSKAVKDMTPEEVAALPEEFKRVKTVVEPNKEAILQAVREGWCIAGVEIEERVSVTIK